MESVLVNFRMPQARYLQIREMASRDSVSVSEYIRNCVERELDLKVIAEREASVWQSELPQDVRELIEISSSGEKALKIFPNMEKDYICVTAKLQK